MSKNLAFLKSVRFWKLVIVAIAQSLASQGIIDPVVSHGITIALLGSVAIRTVDRFGETVGTPSK